MRDGRARAAVKWIARMVWTAEVRVRQALQRVRGRHPPFVLGGACQRCGQCCERPELTVGTLLFNLPAARAGFVWWQRHVNGWRLVGEDPRRRTLAFDCTHFDREHSTCDSYATRPGVCRQYPLHLVDQPAPQLLPGCGYRPVTRGAVGIRAALDAQPLTDEQRARLSRGLHLE